MQVRKVTEEECDFMEKITVKFMIHGIFDEAPLKWRIRAITDDEERVQCCLRIVKRMSSILPQISICAKSSEESLKFRIEGNELYRNNDVLSGIAFYNIALLHAPNKSMQLAYAYGNRSAAFFEIKEYGNCLKDISRALAISDDPELNKKLLQRKAICEEVYKPTAVTEDPADEIRRKEFSLPSHTNPQVPCFSGDIRMGRNGKYGRFILANSDIKPGDVLAVEDTPMIFLHKEFYQRKCFNCFINNDAMIPCPGCRFVMFCDEECYQKSWNKIHKVECPIMELLASEGTPTTFIFAFRTIVGARCDENSWEEFMAAIKAEHKRYPNLRNIKDYQSKARKYTFLYTIETNKRELEPDDIFMRSMHSAVFLHYLENNTRFFTKFTKDTNLDESLEMEHLAKKKCVRFIGEIILQCLMVSDFNTFGLAGREYMQKTNANRITYASALYPFSSAFNHSCAPNAKWIFDKTTLVIKAVRPIKKGQQVFISYGQDYCDNSIGKRTRELIEGYKFKCDCPACVNRWPLRRNLPSVKQLLMESNLPTVETVSPNFYKEVKNENFKYLSNAVTNLCEYSSVIEKFSPSVEFQETHKRIKICWEIFRDKRYL